MRDQYVRPLVLFLLGYTTLTPRLFFLPLSGVFSPHIWGVSAHAHISFKKIKGPFVSILLRNHLRKIPHPLTCVAFSLIWGGNIETHLHPKYYRALRAAVYYFMLEKKPGLQIYSTAFQKILLHRAPSFSSSIYKKGRIYMLWVFKHVAPPQLWSI